MNDDDVICMCMNVTIKAIKDAILSGDQTFQAMQERTGLGTVCGACMQEGEAIFAKLKGELAH